MKRKQFTTNPRVVKAACRVSAAALMLGVSHAGTVGLNFQNNYCSYPGYNAGPVTVTAFGVPPVSWQNLTPMDTGYNSCSGPLSYSLSEVIDTTTSTDGLNPLSSGSLSLAWSGPTGNVSGFHSYPGHVGEDQVYSGFIRDGLNFGPGEGSNGLPYGENDQPGYLIDITGLKSVFTNSSFVVELIASSDSLQNLTNAFIVDVAGGTTNSVTYPSPKAAVSGDTAWPRGIGGGFSTGSGAVNADHIQIMSNKPQHGTQGAEFNNAGTISGAIITDVPLITMQAQPVVAGPGDTVTLNPYAIGVPPLSVQWRLNGTPVPGATNLTITVSNISSANAGNYDFVVTNIYGAVTSAVSSLGDPIILTPASNIVLDSSTAGGEFDGLDHGATWHASVSDGIKTRTGVMTFNGTNTNGIVVAPSTALMPDTGSIMFWVRSPGTIQPSGNGGAAILDCAKGAVGNGQGAGVVIAQYDPGYVQFQGADSNGHEQNENGAGQISDTNWHHVAFTFDDSATGFVNFYFDGALIVPVGNQAAWTWTPTEELEIGFSHDTNWSAFNGSLDDLRIYSRILTDSEVASVYNSDAIVDPTTLQLRFGFDSAPSEGFLLGWSSTSDVLQSAPVATGPYTDIPSVVSPYIVAAKSAQKFFRYRHTPTTTISNPHLM